MKNKICFIAQFPPPMHGLSKAVATLYNSALADEFQFEKVDIADNKKFLKNLIKIFRNNSDLFYFTLSQTKGGNLRDLIIFKLLEFQKKSCLIHLHGGYYRQLVDNDMSSWQRKANYKAIKKLNGAIVLSESLRGIFKEMIADEKIHVVPNCVDDEFLMTNAEFQEKVATIKHKNVLNVLYLSNFIKSKGYREVLKLAKLEKERVEIGEKKRLHFNFAGEFFSESEKNYFKEYIKENELSEFITYHGIVEGQQKKQLLKQCNIFTLLTRYPKEGQPISILEAMGNGMVIMTTDHAGIPDIVQDEVNGIVVTNTEQRDISSLYKKISCEKNIMNNNRNKILQEFVEKRYLSDLHQIFKNCSNSR
ncbi:MULTISPECIES: glycosyltransferase family 4 protein [Priestia]|uniref:glycosyltransferase family 4 protein n=1 Tax=Priestia TaxID=2800373 RepID=UPI002404E77A|nr:MULTISPECIES: glycosyltransferase family 4 protein [Priestia]MDG0060841.1 glycosyltransferase family 4 protein [Priestia sp. P5]WDC89509.1 glycosyltransferase family 4 protein [Priestia megaterium]